MKTISGPIRCGPDTFLAVGPWFILPLQDGPAGPNYTDEKSQISTRVCNCVEAIAAARALHQRTR